MSLENNVLYILEIAITGAKGAGVSGLTYLNYLRAAAGMHARTARLLLLLLVPGQLIFVAVIDHVEGPGDAFRGPFVGLYMAAAIVQVCLLLYLARVLVYVLWTRGQDPDNAAIPFLTALGDLLGSGLLALVYLSILQLSPNETVDTTPGVLTTAPSNHTT